MSLIDSLQRRYDAVFRATDDKEFYTNIHHYLDLVLKTPELEKLINDSQHEYAGKHASIWRREKAKTEEELDRRAELTYRIEHFNLYARMATMYVRIYLPIEDYKNSMEPIDKQDPVALLLMKGLKGAWTKKYRKKDLSSYKKWFNGKREYYEKELREFHLYLVSAYEQFDGVARNAPVIEADLKLNTWTGEWELYGKSGRFSPTSQTFKVLNALYQSPGFQADYLTLLQAMYPNCEESTKSKMLALYPIITELRKELGKDIIGTVQKKGYRLVFKGSAKNQENT